MSKKFTEEQYHEIIKAWESQSFSLKRMQAVLEIMSINDDMPSNINEGFALANPATRELAHERFVEKEKRYVWTSKKPYYKEIYKRLYMSSFGYVIDTAVKDKEKVAAEDEYLTETEVRNYGYDPEWFDKEEVK